MGGVGVVRLEAEANHSSEKARMREPRGPVIRSVDGVVSLDGQRLWSGGVGAYQCNRI